MTGESLSRQPCCEDGCAECVEPENPCPTCNGEGAIGTGYSNSFADISDAMPCPTCLGSGEVDA